MAEMYVGGDQMANQTQSKESGRRRGQNEEVKKERGDRGHTSQ